MRKLCDASINERYTLTDLLLIENNIGDDGVSKLFNALISKHCNVERLNLGYCS